MLQTSRKTLTKWCSLAVAAASIASTLPADDDHTTGSVEPRLVFIEADPNDSAKFEEYRDVPEGLVLDNFDLEWDQNLGPFEGGMYFDIDAKDPVQKDQRWGIDFGSRSKWKANFSYTENPRRFGDGARTLYTTDGHGNFTLDDNLQAAMQAAPASADADADGEWDPGTKGAILRDAIAQSASPIDVGWQRKTGSMGWEFTPTKSWRLGFDAQRERRDGTKVFPVTTNGFSEVSELPAPIDYTTDFLMPYFEFQRKNWMIGARYTWSAFRNDETTITWDNVVQLADGPLNGAHTSAPAGMARMSAGTDNDMGRGEVYFVGKLAGHTRINLTASNQTTTQDDAFLDQTVNSLLQPILEAAPYDAYHLPHDLNGKYTDDVYDLRVDSHPLDWFRVKGWWHEYDHHNKNPMFEVLNMTGDSSIPADPTVAGTTTIPKNANTLRENLPYSYDKTQYGILFGFEPADFADIQLSWDREDIARDFAAIHDQAEDTWKLTADFDVTEKFAIRATAKTQDRSADNHGYDAEYIEESFPLGENVLFGANEGERKAMWADRKRDSYSLMAEFTPIQKLSIYAQFDQSRARFYDPNTGQRIGTSIDEERMFPDGVTRDVNILLGGRTKENSEDYTLGFGIHPNPNWEIGFEHTWDRTDTGLASRYRNVTGFYDTRPGSPPLPAGGQVNMGWDFPEDNWTAQMKDRYRTLGVDWRGKFAHDKWTTRGDITWTHGLGDIHMTYAAGAGTIPDGIGGRTTPQVIGTNGDNPLEDFPQLDNTFTTARVAFERTLASNWDVGFEVWYEKWSFDDWQSDLKAAYVGNPSQDPADATWIQLGNDFLDYDNVILMVIARYHF